MKNCRFASIFVSFICAIFFAGCSRGPDIVKFDKVVYDIPAFSAMTYDQAQLKLGVPSRTRQGNVARGAVTMAVWDSADKTMGLNASYDDATRLPYSLNFHLNGGLSTPDELRKATNLQQDDPRLEVKVSEAPRETRIRREGEMDLVFYDAVNAKVKALQDTPAEREFMRKFGPAHPSIKEQMEREWAEKDRLKNIK